MNFKVWLGHTKKMTYEHHAYELGKVIGKDISDDMILLRGSGIKDKNGREIFEHDVLRGDSYPYKSEGEENYLAVMDWIFNGWQIVSCKCSERVSGVADGINHQVEDEQLLDFEVIGNLYENKEFAGLYE